MVSLIFLKHNGLCARLADSNYFSTEKSIAHTNLCVCIMLFTCNCACLRHGNTYKNRQIGEIGEIFRQVKISPYHLA